MPLEAHSNARVVTATLNHLHGGRAKPTRCLIDPPHRNVVEPTPAHSTTTTRCSSSMQRGGAMPWRSRRSRAAMIFRLTPLHLFAHYSYRVNMNKPAMADPIEDSARPGEGVCGMLILEILAAWSAISVITGLLAGGMIRRMGRDHVAPARGTDRARSPSLAECGRIITSRRTAR
jgi:hypothetical protein